VHSKKYASFLRASSVAGVRLCAFMNFRELDLNWAALLYNKSLIASDHYTLPEEIINEFELLNCSRG
jgi:hypothetical protein